MSNHNKYERMIIKGPSPILKAVCTPVVAGEDNTFLHTLERVCRKIGNAAGLAAPQIGMTRRAFFTLVKDHNTGPIRGRMFINPEVVELAPPDEFVTATEGCLSYPGIEVPVSRPDWVRLSFRTEVGGDPREETFHGWQARVVLHEFDHLDGICQVGDSMIPFVTGVAPKVAPATSAKLVSAIAMATLNG